MEPRRGPCCGSCAARCTPHPTAQGLQTMRTIALVARGELIAQLCLAQQVDVRREAQGKLSAGMKVGVETGVLGVVGTKIEAQHGAQGEHTRVVATIADGREVGHPVETARCRTVVALVDGAPEHAPKL